MGLLIPYVGFMKKPMKEYKRILVIEPDMSTEERVHRFNTIHLITVALRNHADQILKGKPPERSEIELKLDIPGRVRETLSRGREEEIAKTVAQVVREMAQRRGGPLARAFLLNRYYRRLSRASNKTLDLGSLNLEEFASSARRKGLKYPFIRSD